MLGGWLETTTRRLNWKSDRPDMKTGGKLGKARRGFRSGRFGGIAQGCPSAWENGQTLDVAGIPEFRGLEKRKFFFVVR